MSEPDYIVVYDPGRLAGGTWYDISVGHSFAPVFGDPTDCEAVLFEPTGQFEVRSDGAVAQVWTRKITPRFA